MAKTRRELSQDLKKVLPGISHFYFSPPNGTQLQYPCCIYKLVGDNKFYADDIPFFRAKRYTVTIIDQNPDSEFSDQLIAGFPYCTLDRPFTMDNMNHFVHTLFY